MNCLLYLTENRGNAKGCVEHVEFVQSLRSDQPLRSVHTVETFEYELNGLNCSNDLNVQGFRRGGFNMRLSSAEIASTAPKIANDSP